MKEIWIATSNNNKIQEFKKMFECINIIVKSLLDLTIYVPEIFEIGTTFKKGAFLKADYLSKILNKPVLAGYSGLEIIGLGNFPDFNNNLEKSITYNNIINNLLIEKYQSLNMPYAKAICVLCYINPITNEIRYFKGITKGIITKKPVNNNFFSYDSIFFLPEVGKTYTELTTIMEKKKYLHCSKSFQIFKKWWLRKKNEDNKKINIILFEPEIAQNVGAIMRTCVAINARLHLIEPFGFIFDERFITRSSANYVKFADYEIYNDWNHFLQLNPNLKLYCATRYAQKPHSAIDFTKDEKIFVLFGRESTGIPKSILKKNLLRTFRIPMLEKVRSLNIANTVGIVSYEIMRQLNYPGLSKVEIQKGSNFLK